MLFCHSCLCFNVLKNLRKKNQCKSVRAKIRQKISTIFTATTATAISWPTKSSPSPWSEPRTVHRVSKKESVVDYFVFFFVFRFVIDLELDSIWTRIWHLRRQARHSPWKARATVTTTAPCTTVVVCRSCRRHHEDTTKKILALKTSKSQDHTETNRTTLCDTLFFLLRIESPDHTNKLTTKTLNLWNSIKSLTCRIANKII